MRAKVGDVVTIKEANGCGRDLPIQGEARGKVIDFYYAEADNEYVYRVRFFIDGSEWSVGEYEIIEVGITREKVVFT